MIETQTLPGGGVTLPAAGTIRPLMTLPRQAAPMLPLYDALSHHLFGTPRIATPEVVRSAVSGKVWNGSSARAKAELGWMPRVPFEQSLAETLAVLRPPR